MKCKPEIAPILKWFGQVTYIHLRGPSSMRLPPSTSKSLEREGWIPLLQLFTSSSLSYRFSARKKEMNTSKLKTRLAKTFLRPFSQTIASQKVVISAEIWGVFIGLKRIQIWAPKFGLQNLNSLWVPDAGGATAQRSGATARPFGSLVGLQI